MKMLTSAVMWVLSGFMILAGIIYFPSFASVIMVLFAVIAAPIKPLQEQIKKIRIFGWKKGAILCVVFFFAISLAPTSTKDNDSKEIVQYPSESPVQTFKEEQSPSHLPASSSAEEEKEEHVQMQTETPQHDPPVEKTPENTQEEAPKKSEAPKQTKNTNSSGKDRRNNWPKGSYLGSTDSDKYHDYECRAAKTILPENEIWFSSEESAKSSGYSRCGICW